MTAAAEPETSLAADLTWGATWPSVELFEHLAGGRRVIPVVRKLLADAETPIGIYRKLARDEPGTFLLESAEHGGVWSRYSFIGAASRATPASHGRPASSSRFQSWKPVSSRKASTAASSA